MLEPNPPAVVEDIELLNMDALGGEAYGLVSLWFGFIRTGPMELLCDLGEVGAYPPRDGWRPCKLENRIELILLLLTLHYV